MTTRTCLECGRPMRSQRTRIANAPGTVAYKGRGLCQSCYAAAQRVDALDQFPTTSGKGPTTKPAPRPDDAEASRIRQAREDLARYLARRRQRLEVSRM